MFESIQDASQIFLLELTVLEESWIKLYINGDKGDRPHLKYVMIQEFSPPEDLLAENKEVAFVNGKESNEDRKRYFFGGV